jgi:hypothetical protein
MQKYIIAMITLLTITSIQASNELNYGAYENYFQLGEVEFNRSAGMLGERTSDYHVTVTNNYSFEICLIPTLDLIKNGRNEFLEPNFIIPANTEVELGHYGAQEFGKSWHVKWDFFISTNLENCVI